MKVGICAILRDCNPKYLKEWIEWHQFLGVDYFFIYDNDSKIPIVSEQENIIVKKIQGNVQQLNAYNDCLRLHKENKIPKCDWIAFIDDDEFIVIESGDIKQFLSTRQGAGVALNWMVFGPSAPEDFDLPQVLKYRKHIGSKNPMCKHVKVIIRPEYVKDFWNPHSVHTELNQHIITVRGEILINSPFSDNIVLSTAWINHYYCRSEKEFLEKVKRGRPDSLKGYSMKPFYELRDASLINSDTAAILYGIYKMDKRKEIIVMRDNVGEDALEKLIKEIQLTHDTKKMTMVEIGSYAGESTVIFAKHFKKVYAIDPFIENYDPKDPACSCASLSTTVFDAFKERTKSFDNIVHIKMTSDNAILQLEDKRVDFVYIDGNHEYHQVKKDILNYMPIIKKGNYIGGHDFVVTQKYAWVGVKEAVLEILGMPDMLFRDGSWLKLLK